MITIILLLFSFTKGDFNSELDYVNEWKEIAIIESKRTGIPASIILGQAVLESSAGKSKLAREAKNHFGLKCKKYWMGHKYFHYDDDYNEKSELIHSCFRKYNCDLDSFIDHSHFLMENICYRDLLKYGNDFNKWALGLMECGYATDSKYYHKLINIIERLNLDSLDKGI